MEVYVYLISNVYSTPLIYPYKFITKTFSLLPIHYTANINISV